MKNKKFRFNILILILVFSIILTGCGGGNGNGPSESGDNAKDPKNPSSLLEGQDQGGQDNNNQENLGLWTDEEEIVTIRKTEEGLFISYDFDKLDDLYNFSDYAERTFDDLEIIKRELPILGLGGQVKEVALGKIGGYGEYYEEGFAFPVAIFLLEDGSLEWMITMPYLAGEYDVEEEMAQYSFGWIPWMENIDSLSLEVDYEGVGDLEIYANSKDGLQYKVKYPLDYSDLLFGEWVAFIQEYTTEFDYISISLSTDMSAFVSFRNQVDDVSLDYMGTYDIHFDNSSSKGYRAPSISLDLDLEIVSPPHYIVDKYNISGTFMLDTTGFGAIDFYHSDGDDLFDNIYYYNFEINAYDNYDGAYFDVWNYSDEELVYYVLDVVPEAKYNVEKLKMATMVGEDGVYIDEEGYCRSVLVGTNHNYSFVTEYHYAVTDFGGVYELDVVNDIWNLVFWPNES